MCINQCLLFLKASVCNLCLIDKELDFVKYVSKLTKSTEFDLNSSFDSYSHGQIKRHPYIISTIEMRVF